MPAMMVRKMPASCGCSGQALAVKPVAQAPTPTTVPMTVAMSVIFQDFMNAPFGVLYAESPKFVPTTADISLLAERIDHQTIFPPDSPMKPAWEAAHTVPRHSKRERWFQR